MPLTQPAMAPIDAATRFGPRGGLLLLLAAALQWFDAAPLRADVTVRVQHPANAHIDLLAWRAAIARHDAVRVVPPYACLEKPTTWGTSMETGWPSMAASASMPPTPQPRTPRPLTIVVWESVPTRVSG